MDAYSSYNRAYSTDQGNKKLITSDQLNEILEAILDGKYSWACVLLLRFTGSNPLHYIPCRTYSRLRRENNDIGISNKVVDVKVSSRNQANQRCFSTIARNKVRDLDYQEAIGGRDVVVRGGNRVIWLFSKRQHAIS